ncbi:hypothetical protein [Ligilactobacillus salivarius]|nr:hypothetical protein [Ligilactobacillus salivarius]
MNHTAKKVTVGSFTFDSQKEANFYLKLSKIVVTSMKYILAF